MGRLVDYRGRMLNHVEMLYQPGERRLAIKALEALGCKVAGGDRPTMTAHVALDGEDAVNNVLYASEVAPEQWALEQAFKRATQSNTDLAKAYAVYQDRYRNRPHGIAHFGIRYPSYAKLEAALAHLEKHLAAELRGRFSVTHVYRPADADRRTDTLIQAFVATDIIASGLFVFGQLIELQAQELEAA